MDSPTRNTWHLRPADQRFVAVLSLVGLIVLGGWWVVQAGWRNRMVEADNTQHRVARFQVDINTAELPELMHLPGIGDTLARRIIEVRQTTGPFAESDDLRRVKGIGPKIMERIRPYLPPLPKDGMERRTNNWTNEIPCFN